MSAKILIISPYDLQSNNASINCISRIIESLRKDNANIVYFCVNQNSLEYHDQYINNIRVYMFPSKKTIYHKKIVTMSGKTLSDRILRKINYVCLKICTIFNLENYHWAINFKRMKSIFLKMTEEKKFDAIISFSLPFTSHIFANRLHKLGKSTRWIPYELDPFALNYTRNRLLIPIRKKLEKKCFSIANHIISTIGILEHNSEAKFRQELVYKSTSMPLPILRIIENHHQEKYEYDFCYVGSFYKKFRNPSYMFKILSNVLIGKHIIIAGGDIPWNSNSYIEKLKVNNKVTILGWVSLDKSKDIIEKSRFLLNLSNNLPNQIPSKVVDYISTGKKIINFYYNDDDPSFIYLKEYPHIINIKINSSDTQVLKELCIFIGNLSYQIDYNDLRCIYKNYQEDVVLQKILNIIGGKNV
ncbi:MAG TPA: hypothetical protein PLR26_02305 [Bacilli bacterium]|nr:hypothetical protein [Bacilli bacterium]